MISERAMTDACAFRLHDEKHVSAEVERMVWSPKMDLLAVATVQGEVNSTSYEGPSLANQNIWLEVREATPHSPFIVILIYITENETIMFKLYPFH